MQHQMSCPCVFKGNSYFEPDEISARRMGQINKIFHVVWAGFPPLMVVVLFRCLWTRTHKWKPIQIRPSSVLTLVSRRRMDRKHKYLLSSQRQRCNCFYSGLPLLSTLPPLRRTSSAEVSMFGCWRGLRSALASLFETQQLWLNESIPVITLCPSLSRLHRRLHIDHMTIVAGVFTGF